MPRPASSAAPSPASTRPTLRQIAAVVGVSAMTVSRALRNHPRVTAPLRKKIQKAAKDLGYRPDPAVIKLMSHLRQRKTSAVVACIAAVTSIPETEAEPHQMREVLAAARLRAEELGYRLELFRIGTHENSAHDLDKSRHDRVLERTLVNRGIEGVMMLQMMLPTVADRLLGWNKFSAVLATASVVSPDFPRVGANHFQNARLVCAKLAGRGCARIGVVCSETFRVRTQDAFAAAAAQHALVAGRAAVRPLVFAHRDRALDELPTWLGREQPDALLVHVDNLVPLIRERLRGSAAARLPVVCTAVDPGDPACPGIDERNDLIGRKSIDVLTAMLNRSEKNYRTAHVSTLIEGRWCEPAFSAKP